MTELNEDDAARAEARRAAAGAKEASVALARMSNDARNAALHAMACALRERAAHILAANGEDMRAARERGTSEALLDRLALDAARVEDMARALDDLRELPDPLGVVQEHRTLYNGLDLMRVSVPLGVVAVVYEARPNVTADAAGICLKAGCACVLRGGSLAVRSCTAIGRILADAACAAGAPAGSIAVISSASRAATDELLGLTGVVDVLIPRGGAGLIRHCVEEARVPVIETGTGNCHVYVDVAADLERAHDIALNAKCRRYGVCNACETLLVADAVADRFLPRVMTSFSERGVVMHADERAAGIAQAFGIETVPATEDDWAREYLAPEIAIGVVDGLDEAIDHVNRYGTRHSEAIVSEDETACQRFQAEVDAAAVYANASTAFTDGGQFGLGAEIGISTQKLHVRGPFALAGLTSYKYLVTGDGQVRE